MANEDKTVELYAPNGLQVKAAESIVDALKESGYTASKPSESTAAKKAR